MKENKDLINMKKLQIVLNIKEKSYKGYEEYR